METEALVLRIKEAYGEEIAGEIERGWRAMRKTTFRTNAIKSDDGRTEEELKAAGVEYERINGAFAVGGDRASFVRELKAYERGEIYMQSLSSMLPPYALGARAGEDILDMCAAPGGKTSQIVALTGGGAFVTACEKDRFRAERLKHNLALMGAGRVNVMVKDACSLDPAMRFDRILLDAPCTGSGTITPSSPGKYSEKLLASCVKAQRALLTKAMTLLKKGGTLVYSTCSLLPEENEEAAKFAVSRGAELVGTGLAPERARLLPTMAHGALLVAPDEYYEGFFVAKFVVK